VNAYERGLVIALAPATSNMSLQYNSVVSHYAEGDVMMSELGKDDDPGICIPACKNRLSGKWLNHTNCSEYKEKFNSAAQRVATRESFMNCAAC
jgi:hypothetical protein